MTVALNLHPSLRVLLDFIGSPALVVERKGQWILAANLAASRQTGYSQDALQKMGLARLFPEMPHCLDYSEGHKGVASVTFLQRRNGTSLRVMCQFKPLVEDRSLWLVIFSPFDKSLLDEPQSVRPCVQAWRRMVRALALEDIGESMQSVLEGGMIFMEASWAAAYLLSAPVFQLQGRAGAVPDLPLSLPLQQADVFAQAHVYHPSEVAATPLHAMVRTSEAPHLVVAPLKSGQSLSGFVVFGYTYPPSKNMLRESRIVTRYVREALDYRHAREQVRTMKADIKRSRAVVHAVLQHSSEGVLVFDEHLRLLCLGASAAQILGYHPDEVQQAALSDLLLGEISLDGMARKVLALAAPQEVEVHLLRREGSEFPAEVRMVPLQPKEGERPLGVVVIMHDLSEEAHYREQTRLLLRRAMLGDILASFAHEVRDPLNSISTGLEWLAYSLPDGTQVQDTLRNLQQDVERLDYLVGNLLDYSRARPLQLRPLDVVPLIEGIFRRWQRRFEKYRIHAEWRAEGEIPHVYGDRLSLEQVFTNLLDNAIRALAHQQGARFIAVRVASVTTDTTPWVEISVVDNGPGFDDAVKHRLFEPFFTTREEGTGLGLAITKQLVTAHRGSIEAHSYPQGGTIFRVRLRAVMSKEEEAEDEAHGV